MDAIFLPINLPICVFTDRKGQPFELIVTPNQTEASVTWSGISVPPGEGDAYIFKTNPNLAYLAPHTRTLTFHIEQGILTIPKDYPKSTDSDWIFDKTTGRKRMGKRVRVTYIDSRQIKVWVDLTSRSLGQNRGYYLLYDSKSKTYLYNALDHPSVNYIDETGAFVILISPDFKGEISFEGKRYIVDKTENQLIVKED